MDGSKKQAESKSAFRTVKQVDYSWRGEAEKCLNDLSWSKPGTIISSH